MPHELNDAAPGRWVVNTRDRRTGRRTRTKLIARRTANCSGPQGRGLRRGRGAGRKRTIPPAGPVRGTRQLVAVLKTTSLSESPADTAFCGPCKRFYLTLIIQAPPSQSSHLATTSVGPPSHLARRQAAGRQSVMPKSCRSAQAPQRRRTPCSSMSAVFGACGSFRSQPHRASSSVANIRWATFMGLVRAPGIA
jgi:hypothetical protein